ncbi:MAG: nucleotidyl transferase AbiEii/AbiGii toxin family protein [Sedimenticola sp.]
MKGTTPKKYSDRLKSYVREYANTIVLPHIQDQLKEFPYADEYTTEISNDGEKIWINYPSVVKEGSNYIKRHILVELGGRNVIDPNERHTVVPDAATIVDTVDFPSSEVIVLSPERTFWEKATLIHVECNRTKPRNNYNRFSRHWYDMVKMSQHDIGKAAINNRKLLEDVINHKQVFFYYSHANYEACQKGELNLIPNGDLLSRLHSDYEEMLAANMMYGEPPSFDELMDELNGIEQNINGC